MKILILCTAIAMCLITQAQAQCAMCKASIENMATDGGGLAAGLNMGIMYLAAMPYLAFIIIAWAWYRHSRRAQAAQQTQRWQLGKN